MSSNIVDYNKKSLIVWQFAQVGNIFWLGLMDDKLTYNYIFFSNILDHNIL
jgi:hypothetical protein